MDAYAYAMKMERDGEVFYRGLQDKTANKGLKTILGMLADAEVRHYKTFLNLKKGEEIRQTTIEDLAYVQNIFEILLQERLYLPLQQEIGLYKMAQDIEQQSRTFYLQKAEEVPPLQQLAFRRIADEELRHYQILEDIISMVDKPNNWLENAEWHHLDDY